MARTVYRPKQPFLPTLCLVVICAAVLSPIIAFIVPWLYYTVALNRMNPVVDVIFTLVPMAITLAIPIRLMIHWLQRDPRSFFTVYIGVIFLLVLWSLDALNNLGGYLRDELVDPTAFARSLPSSLVTALIIGALLAVGTSGIYRSVFRRVLPNPGDRCWRCGQQIDPQIVEQINRADTPSAPTAACPECGEPFRAEHSPPDEMTTSRKPHLLPLTAAILIISSLIMLLPL